MSTISASTVSEFLDQKVQEFELDIEYIAQYRLALRKMYNTKTLSRTDWIFLREELESQERDNKKEYTTLKRQ